MKTMRKETANRFSGKLFSPLYIAVTLVSVIIIGNLLNWADSVYGTHLNALKLVLAAITAFLFAAYIYRVCKVDSR